MIEGLGPDTSGYSYRVGVHYHLAMLGVDPAKACEVAGHHRDGAIDSGVGTNSAHYDYRRVDPTVGLPAFAALVGWPCPPRGQFGRSPVAPTLAALSEVPQDSLNKWATLFLRIDRDLTPRLAGPHGGSAGSEGAGDVDRHGGGSSSGGTLSFAAEAAGLRHNKGAGQLWPLMLQVLAVHLLQLNYTIKVCRAGSCNTTLRRLIATAKEAEIAPASYTDQTVLDLLLTFCKRIEAKFAADNAGYCGGFDTASSLQHLASTVMTLGGHVASLETRLSNNYKVPVEEFAKAAGEFRVVVKNQLALQGRLDYLQKLLSAVAGPGGAGGAAVLGGGAGGSAGGGPAAASTDGAGGAGGAMESLPGAPPKFSTVPAVPSLDPKRALPELFCTTAELRIRPIRGTLVHYLPESTADKV